jgi:hypothetical protein
MAERRWVLAHEGPLPMNQNGSDSPWRKRTDRRAWRAYAPALARNVELPRETLVRVRISGTVYRRNLGVADAPGDLERFKSVVDGLVEGSYLPDDTRRYVDYTQPAEAHISGEHPRGFELVIEELPHDAETAKRAAAKYEARRRLDIDAAARRAAKRRPRGAAPGRSARPPAGARPQRRRPAVGVEPAAAAAPAGHPARAQHDRVAGGAGDDHRAAPGADGAPPLA